MKKDFNSWALLGIFLVAMACIFIFNFRDKIFGTIRGDDYSSHDVTPRSNQKDNMTRVLKCSKETVSDSEKDNEIVNITYQDEELIMYESEKTVTSNQSVELSFGLMKSLTDVLSKLDGITMNTQELSDTSYKVRTKIIYDEVNYDQLSKLITDDKYKDIADNDIYKNKTIGYNEYLFKLEKDGYSCE